MKIISAEKVKTKAKFLNLNLDLLNKFSEKNGELVFNDKEIGGNGSSIDFDNINIKLNAKNELIIEKGDEK